METKFCNICKCERDILDYYVKPNGKPRTPCKLCTHIKNKKWYEENTRRAYELTQKWRKANLEKFNEFQRKSRRKRDPEMRLNIITRYTNGKMNCECCGESEYDFLNIDHFPSIKDGGINLKSRGLMGWIIRNNYPDGIRILCYNCNMGRAKFNDGICPHKRKADELMSKYAQN